MTRCERSEWKKRGSYRERSSALQFGRHERESPVCKVM